MLFGVGATGGLPVGVLGETVCEIALPTRQWHTRVPQ